MSQSLEARLSQEMEARLEARMSMAQQLAAWIQEVEEAFGTSEPQRLYDDMLARLREHARIPEAVDMLSHPAIRHTCLKFPESLASPSMAIFQKVAEDSYYQGSDEGAFEFPADSGDRMHYRTTYECYTHAFSDAREPDELKRELPARLRIIQAQQTGPGARAPDQGTIQAESEIRAAQEIQHRIAPHVAALAQMIHYAMSVTDAQGRHVFRDFFRGLTVQHRLRPIISERIQNRFANRFSQFGPRAPQRDGEIPTLNSIAEFTLVSMGIVHPDLFSLRRAVADDIPEEVDDLAVQELVEKWKLKINQSFYFNRWAVRGARLTRETDDAVREFIAEEIRRHREPLLSAVDYPAFFRRVKETNAEAKQRTLDPDEHRDQLRAVVTGGLSGIALRDTLATLVRDHWFDRINALFGNILAKERQD